MLKRRGKRGKKRREDRWREGNRRCDERCSRGRDKKMEGTDETKKKIVVCVWLTPEREEREKVDENKMDRVIRGWSR